MSQELEKLKSIGAQKIHELTHISREHVQAVLHETFDGLNKVQFLGFISILEREYKLNLSDLKAKGLAHFKDNKNKYVGINSKVFTTKKKKYSRLSYAFFALIILILLSYFELIPTMGGTTQVSEQVSNEVIENAQKNIETTTSEAMDSNDSNISVMTTTDANSSDENDTVVVAPSEAPKIEMTKVEIPAPKAAEVVSSFKIMPKAKVWMGYIDIKENKKYQKMFDGEVSLDPKKDWLLLLGHGNLDIDINGKVEQFRTSQNIRFKYINRQLTKITISEFKEMNKDSQW